MGGAMNRSFIRAYFLTAWTYKRMHLTTRVYSRSSTGTVVHSTTLLMLLSSLRGLIQIQSMRMGYLLYRALIFYLPFTFIQALVAINFPLLFLQTVHLEKKKLLQQWNNSLIGMRRRDEAYSAMVAAVKYVCV